MIANRNVYIDYLRTFGLLCLVVAHTWPPEWLKILRAFDVPLMVFISALCYHPYNGGWIEYLRKRCIRIYKPVVVFLTLFFILTCGLSFFIPDLNFGWRKILGSYLLFNEPSIGYVWIMRVFVMIALVVPLMYRYVVKWSVCKIVMLLATLWVAVSAIVANIEMFKSHWVIRFIVNEYIVYLLAYSIIAIVGIRAIKATSKELSCYMLIALMGWVIYVLIMDQNFAFNPNLTKYPPHGLYILYGLFVSVFLWLIKPLFNCLKLNKAVQYISDNSMWLYLWHIVLVYALIPFSKIPNTWFLRYVIVCIGMILLNLGFDKSVALIKQIATPKSSDKW